MYNVFLVLDLLFVVLKEFEAGEDSLKINIQILIGMLHSFTK